MTTDRYVQHPDGLYRPVTDTLYRFEELQAAVDEHGSATAAAKALGLPSGAVRRTLKRADMAAQAQARAEVSDADRALIAALAGHTYAQAAERLGISETYLANRVSHLRALGLDIPYRSGPVDPDRLRALRGLAEEGLTLQEAADTLRSPKGEPITRERARQLFNKYGLAHVREAAYRARQRKVAAERLRSGVEEFLDHGVRPVGKRSRRAVAHLVGVDSGTGTKWTSTEMKACLREAEAILGRPLSCVLYDQVVRGLALIGDTLPDGRDRPGSQTITKTFGGWSAACEAARVAHGVTHTNYKRRWEPEQIAVLCRRYAYDALSHGRKPTIPEMVATFAASGGPSLATVRSRVDPMALFREVQESMREDIIRRLANPESVATG